MGQAANEMTGYSSPDDYDAGTNANSPDVNDASAADNQDPEAIRAEIEQTRSDMSETIDAIQAKLDPGNLKEQAKDAVREATVGRAEEVVNNVSESAKGFGANMLETIKDNPIPAALAGIGLGWLWMRSQDRQRRTNENQYAYRQYGGRGSTSSYLGYEPNTGYANPSYAAGYSPSGSGGRGPVDAVADAAGNATDKVGQAVGSATDKVGDIAGNATDKVGQIAGSAGDTVGQLGDQAQYKAEQATDFFQRSLRENPLAVGAVALAVGAAVGLMIPETPQEHQLMGQARDNLVDKAQGAVQDTMQKVQRVASEATDTAKQEAQDQGLSS